MGIEELCTILTQRLEQKLNRPDCIQKSELEKFVPGAQTTVLLRIALIESTRNNSA